MPQQSDPGTRPPDWETTILSIRQARDQALAREAEMAQRLREAVDRVSELEDALADARAAGAEALRRETVLRKDRDELQMKLLEMNGQKLAYLESEWRTASALSEVRQQLSLMTSERDRLQRQLQSKAEDEPDRVKMERNSLVNQQVAEALQVEVETLRAMLQEREAMLDAQQRRFSEEHAVLEAQLLATRIATYQDSDSADESGAADEDADQPVEIADTLKQIDQLLSGLTGSEKDQPQLEALRELLGAIEQHAAASGKPHLHRVTRAILEMLLWLRNSPGKIAASLPDLRAGIAMISDLASRDELPPLGSGAVYAVDDDIDNCECIAMALQKFQLNATYSAAPAKALLHLQQTPQDLVLLDFDMPGMNGMELLDAMRASPANRETPVLFVSGLESVRALVDALDDASVEFINKPYNLTTLSLKALMLMIRSSSERRG